MEELFLYLGKMIFCSVVIFSYYLLFLRDKTFHHYNRFYLLATLVVSILLPLLKVEYFTIETDNRILLLFNQWNQSSAETPLETWSFGNIIAYVLYGVSVMLILKMALGLLKINHLKKTFPKESVQGITFYNTNLQEAPFSFFRNLFWKESILLQSDLGRQILKHEMVHIEQKHSYDKLFVQLVQCLFWINPVFYFIKKEIHLIHEYLADQKAVQQSDTRAFAKMLLASHFSGNVLPATSPFLSSNLKKRLHMLTQKTTHYSYARRILVLPMLFIISFALLVNAKNTEIKKNNRDIAHAIEQMKQDTLKPNDLQQRIQTHQEKIQQASEKLKQDQEKIKLLSTETQKKSEELKKIAKEKGENSYEYELKAKELDQLGNEIEKIASKKQKLKAETIEFFSGDLENTIPSDLFKNKFQWDEKKIKEWVKKMDPKDFKEGVINIKKLKLPEGLLFMEGIENVESPTEIDNFTWQEKTPKDLSKEDRKKLEKLSKEKAELAKKQAEIAKKQAELAIKQAEITGGHPKLKIEIRQPDQDQMLIKSNILKDFTFKTEGEDSANSPKIYINGKAASKEEMNQLKPGDITTVNVFKTSNNGKNESEIRIQTK